MNCLVCDAKAPKDYIFCSEKSKNKKIKEYGIQASQESVVKP